MSTQYIKAGPQLLALMKAGDRMFLLSPWEPAAHLLSITYPVVGSRSEA